MLVLQGKVVLVKLLEFWCGVGYPFEGVIDKFPAAIVGGNHPLLFTEDLQYSQAGSMCAPKSFGRNISHSPLQTSGFHGASTVGRPNPLYFNTGRRENLCLCRFPAGWAHRSMERSISALIPSRHRVIRAVLGPICTGSGPPAVHWTAQPVKR